VIIMRYLGLLFVLTFLACSSEDTGGSTGGGGGGGSSGTSGRSGSGGSGTSSGSGVGVGRANGSSSGDTCGSKVRDFAACDDDCQCYSGKKCVDPSGRGTKLCTNPCGSSIECIGLNLECRDGYCQPE
jgi:hypothetical protein